MEQQSCNCESNCCDTPKKPLHLIIFPIIFLIIVYIILKFFGPIPLSINSIVTNKTDLFTASGQGKVTAAPDMAIITLGMTVTQNSVKDAQNQVNNTINKISNDVKKLGVEEKDIKTINYSINPNYDYSNGRQRVNGYQVSANLEIKVRNLESVNTVIDTATADGANTVGNLQFQVEEKRLKELQKQARELAVKEAKDKAEGLAQAAGISLGKVINIQETTTPNNEIRAMKSMLDSSGTGGAPTEVQPGSQEININVTLTYEIK